MIQLPRTPDQVRADGVIRAGGTDLQERRHVGLSTEPLIDLRDLGGLQDITWTPAGGMQFGAKVRLAELAAHDEVRTKYPGLAAAAGALATPQIRAVASLGGSLLQSVRCWYFRRPGANCHMSGGDSCPAREGDHHYHSCFDLGPCIAPHPSTVGMTLLAYEGWVEIHGAKDRTAEELFGDGSDPTRTHTLNPGELLTNVLVPPPVAGERAAYFRSISRARAEWPLVEVIVRLVLEGEFIRFARVAMGGVANIPLRLKKVEQHLSGAKADEETFQKAGEIAVEGAEPLPMTAYKVPLIKGTVQETLERAVS